MTESAPVKYLDNTTSPCHDISSVYILFRSSVAGVFVKRQYIRKFRMSFVNFLIFRCAVFLLLIYVQHRGEFFHPFLLSKKITRSNNKFFLLIKFLFVFFFQFSTNNVLVFPSKI